MDKINCPIWGTPAEGLMLANDSWSINSPRSGGQYTITGTRFVTVGGLSDEQKVLVTSWLASQRLKGKAVPHISVDLDVDSIHPLTVLERAEYLLRYIDAQLSNISDRLEYPSFLPDPHQPIWGRYAEMLAWSSSTELEDLYYLLRFLEDRGLISPPPRKFQSPHRMCILTVEGHTHLAELKARS